MLKNVGSTQIKKFFTTVPEVGFIKPSFPIHRPKISGFKRFEKGDFGHRTPRSFRTPVGYGLKIGTHIAQRVTGYRVEIILQAEYMFYGVVQTWVMYLPIGVEKIDGPGI